MSRILVVGDVVDDIIVRPLTAVTPASDTNAEIRMHAGGSAANVAAWLGRLGADVTFVGRAGHAGVARHRSALEAFGVDARIVADRDRVTGTIVLTLDDSGERTMYVDRGANAALVPDDAPTEVWTGAPGSAPVGWLHLTGYSFFDDEVRPTALALVRTAQEVGAGVSVDPSSVAFLRECGVREFLGWTEGIDLLFPNLDEGRALTGKQEPEDIVTSLRSTYGGCVLTLGAKGAWASVGSGDPVWGGASAGPIVDTTGAGDAYCAGFLSQWALRAQPAVCMQVAGHAAGVAARRIGARPPVH